MGLASIERQIHPVKDGPMPLARRERGVPNGVAGRNGDSYGHNVVPGPVDHPLNHHHVGTRAVRQAPDSSPVLEDAPGHVRPGDHHRVAMLGSNSRGETF